MKTEKFYLFIKELRNKQISVKEPLSFSEVLKLYINIVMEKSIPENPLKELRDNNFKIEVTPEILRRIEEILLTRNSNSWITQHLFNLLFFSKTLLPQNVLKSLCAISFEEITDKPYRIEELCNYLAGMKISGYCNFFKRVLYEYGLQYYQAGDISIMAASLGCLNCYDTIKKIAENNNEKNPRTKYFAEKALKILEELKK